MHPLFESFRGRLRLKPPAPYLISSLALLLYVTVLSFSLDGGWFIVDDREELLFVRNAESIASLLGTDVFGLFRPVKNLLFLLFSHLSTHGVRTCRYVGLAIGVIAFFPVKWFFGRIFGLDWKSDVAAAVWILSPTLVSSAAWLSGVNIMVMVAFASLALLFHDKAWDDGSFRFSRILLAALFLFLALASYECAIAVLPSLLLFDAILRGKRIRTRHAWLSYTCYAATVCLYMALRRLASAKTSMPGSWCQAERWQLAISSPWFTAHHFTSWFWPFGRFAVMGNYDWGDASIESLAACMIAGLSILALAVLSRKRTPVLSFCVLFALLGFAPVSNCLGSGNGPYGDYYLSLASLGLAAGSVELMDLLLRAKPGWKVPALFAVVLFAATRACAVVESARWARLWADPRSAFETSARNFPKFVANKVGLVRFVCVEGRYEEALQMGREIEETFGAGTSQTANVHLVRAIHSLLVLKDPQKALKEIDLCENCKSPDLSPRFLDYYRGCVFEDLLENEEEAIRLYESCLGEAWKPESSSCADRLARIKAIHGELTDAIDLWEKARLSEPENVSILWNLSVAYREVGDDIRSKKFRNLALEQAEKRNHK